MHTSDAVCSPATSHSRRLDKHTILHYINKCRAELMQMNYSKFVCPVNSDKCQSISHHVRVKFGLFIAFCKQ